MKRRLFVLLLAGVTRSLVAADNEWPPLPLIVGGKVSADWREPKRPVVGYIGLQNHDPGEIVWFREVSVRSLPRKL
jgi:hypothetical protein